MFLLKPFQFKIQRIWFYELCTVQWVILEGRNFGKLQNLGDWQVLIWRMTIKAPNHQN